MKNFAVVQEHFRKLRCAHCQQSFTPDGVKLLRAEKDYWVVRVHCTSCQQPAGVAIVGVEYESSDVPAAAGEPRGEREMAAPVATGQRVRGIFSSRKEEEKFSGFEPISDDDLLNAHDFIKDLGSDWMRHLPSRGH